MRFRLGIDIKQYFTYIIGLNFNDIKRSHFEYIIPDWSRYIFYYFYVKFMNNFSIIAWTQWGTIYTLIGQTDKLHLTVDKLYNNHQEMRKQPLSFMRWDCLSHDLYSGSGAWGSWRYYIQAMFWISLLWYETTRWLWTFTHVVI